MPLGLVINELERISILSPLGIRFWDAVTRTSISDGLTVTASPVSQPLIRRSAFVNRSDVFAFRGLPGLRDVENGLGDDAFWQSPPRQKEFIIEMNDARGHFLPARFQLPVPVKGLARLECLHSPLSSEVEAIPLFSAPARPLPA